MQQLVTHTDTYTRKQSTLTSQSDLGLHTSKQLFRRRREPPIFAVLALLGLLARWRRPVSNNTSTIAVKQNQPPLLRQHGHPWPPPGWRGQRGCFRERWFRTRVAIVVIISTHDDIVWSRPGGWRGGWPCRGWRGGTCHLAVIARLKRRGGTDARKLLGDKFVPIHSVVVCDGQLHVRWGRVVAEQSAAVTAIQRLMCEEISLCQI